MTNRKRILSIVVTAIVTSGIGTMLCPAQEKRTQLKRDYNVLPVPFSQVQVNDDLWAPRLKTNYTVTIPYAFQKCEETGRIRNFEKAAGLKQGKHEGIYFDDSDVYKIMEGAAYSLQINSDPKIRQYLDNLIKIIAAAQWDDGYLYTFYSVPEKQPEKRWTNIGAMHELYCAGHMYEAAAAHFQVTGDKSFLNIATKNADLVCSTFSPGKRTDPPGHQEIEIGLCKLYRATGEVKYLDQAKFFLDQRGRTGNRGPDGKGGLYGTYSQDHIPVTEQTEAVGHSVRAAYLYTGMADVAALTGNMDYIKAIDTIWNDVVGTKLYITGGIGAAGGQEGFGGPYELPNMTAYCETCASIANILWNHRMFLMCGDAKYIDVLERVLYNAALSGISMKGDTFFYPNPLESIGQHSRSTWFGCACCPSNVARFIPSVPGYTYAHKGNNLYVNLFISSRTTIQTPDNNVTLTQRTKYPWEGEINITVEPKKDTKFAVYVRIPGWAQNQPIPSNLYKFQTANDELPVLKVNGKTTPLNIQAGFSCIERKWQKGDTIDLQLPMPIRRVIASENVKTNRGKVALQRGPIVFCLEGPDNEGKVSNLVIPDDAALAAQFRPDLLNGVVVITGKAHLAKRTSDGSIVPAGEKVFTAIPYYAWAHRGPSQMNVWPARIPQAARPEPADTLTYISKTTTSFVHVSLDAIKDQAVPESSSDSSALQLDFWPHKGTTEWIQFEWDKQHDISAVKIYWFDDTGRGECKIPESWKVLYHNDSGEFKPVTTQDTYGTEKDKLNKVSFTPAKTNAIKIEINLQKGWSAGVLEVVIE